MGAVSTPVHRAFLAVGDVYEDVYEVEVFIDILEPESPVLGTEVHRVLLEVFVAGTNHS